MAVTSEYLRLTGSKGKEIGTIGIFGESKQEIMSVIGKIQDPDSP
jgi:hypothetical protein